MIYLSLCIPTNGISAWVFPVLDRVFDQKVDSSLYEVIVTDNGSDQEFKSAMREYAKSHDNLIYKETQAYLFENQIEALRLANGEYLKFLNHRSILEDGALEWMIELVKDNLSDKPIMYLSDGVLDLKEPLVCKNFDEYVAGLRHFASWTTGVGVWRSDFEHIPEDWIYNRISPHSDVLFYERKRDRYLIDDRKWCHDIDSSHANKGKYNLYKAFAVEEISITLSLFTDGDISAKTLKKVIRSYKKFVAWCYMDFNMLHRPCSYDISGFSDAMGVFMSKAEILFIAFLFLPKGIIHRIRDMRKG